MKMSNYSFVQNAIIFPGIFILLSGSFNNSLGQTFTLESPDNSLKLTLNINDKIAWSLALNNETIIQNTTVSITLNGKVLGKSPKLNNQHTLEADEVIYPVLPQKNKEIRNHYRELQLRFEDDYALHFRIYNEGVAYRFVTNIEGEIEVQNEQMDLVLPQGSTSHFPQEESMYSHFERLYILKDVAEIDTDEFASLPVLFSTPTEKRILFTDADLFDYPNAFVKGSEGNHLQLTFPKAVLATIPNPESSDRSEIITDEADYIALTNGTRTFPWRVFGIAGEDKELLENEMVFKLSRAQKLDDVSWIKPGRVAWDWYNANNIWGVDFESGINNQTYKYYIDFASKYGLEYVILDEGWTKSTTEILECNPEIDVKALVEYGAERNVGIILWCLWKPLNENMDEILDLYAAWGTKGIKVDFMQRADQYMVTSFEQIAQACADRQLLVDFHGAFKPSGMRRAFPNIISYEGVKGNENNKWSADITPKHNTTLPFIRNVAGPMDFTPGAMRNAHFQNYHISFTRPMGLGTRAHQVSMYTIFESAIQMLCDSPTAYLEDKETINFISQIPSVWDQTFALDGKIGEYVVMARKKDDQFFVAAMNNENARTVNIDFSFLPEGTYQATVFRDGVNADKYAEDYKVEKIVVTHETQMEIKLIGSGGWSAILSKE